MTQPHDFEGSTHHFGPPKGFPETECGWLHVFSNGRCNVSAWKPSAELLATLNAGGSIFISHMTGVNPNAPHMPVVFPTFVGSETECLEVVSATGKTWK